VPLVCQGRPSGPCYGTGFGQVGDNAVGAVLGDIQAGRDATQPRAWVVGDAQQHRGVAVRKAQPATAEDLSQFLEIYC
jgi:hypothetical protein